jgi:hypothetical protein
MSPYRHYSRFRVWIWRLRRWLLDPPYPKSINDPDLPGVAGDWVILDRGHFGTLGATFVGHGKTEMVMVTAFKGYDQVSGGIVLTRQQTQTVLNMFRED